MDNFQPEYIEADEVIQVDGNYYGIFNVSGPDYSLPLIVFVDSLNYFNNGQPPANVPRFTQEQWDEDNHEDILEYLNGVVLHRNFYKWNEGRGYELKIGRKNGRA